MKKRTYRRDRNDPMALIESRIVACVDADTPAVAQAEARWPDAPWLRFGPKIYLFDRPKGQALEPFMAALRVIAELAGQLTTAWVRHTHSVPPDAVNPRSPQGLGVLHDVLGPFSGINAMMAAYRNYSGEFKGRNRMVIASPVPGGKPIVMEGPPDQRR